MPNPLTRGKSILTAAGVPALTLGMLGDFFSPVGGAMVVLAAGAISSLLALQMLAPGQTRPPLLRRLLDTDPTKDQWWWEGSPTLKKHAFWVALTFGVVSVVSAQQSFANRGSGGYLAREVPRLGRAQLSLLGEVAANTREIADNTQKIEANTRGAKREKSSDPRKELANLGQAWTQQGFAKAVEAEDIPSINLYIDGGMRLNSEITNRVFWNGGVEIPALFAERRVKGDPGRCSDMMDILIFYTFADRRDLEPRGSSVLFVKDGLAEDDVRVDPIRVRAYSSMCSKTPLPCVGGDSDVRFCQKVNAAM